MDKVRAASWFAFAIGLVSATGKTATSLSEFDGDAKERSLQERIRMAKMELWSRGAFALHETALFRASYEGPPTTEFLTAELERQAAMAPLTLGPVRKPRLGFAPPNRAGRTKRAQECLEFECDSWAKWAAMNMRGGGGESDYTARLEVKLRELATKFGPEFSEAIDRNKKEHAADCATSCESFFCADTQSVGGDSWVKEHANTTFASYSFGGVPPEDFADEFGFPLDLIKVSQGEPLFPAVEAADVVAKAEEEGVDKNEYKSGKYRLGGDWLVNLPRTRAWFNERLESTFFPLLSHLFPEIVSSPAVLRAHSVSLLKYNSSHPRTDVHIDNGILAMTLAMTPQKDYVGGGTFFEHFGVKNILAMDCGHGTFRPGSVRHGGHKVSSGTRYILGAFLLIEDKVEHVRRLKNRGSDLRKAGDLDGAAKHFEWALAINPKCTTCLKDWAEILLSKKEFAAAEAKIRSALELLEDQDSDALFTLGILLSEQGKDEESIIQYKKSIELNAEDAELCYNLGIKLGARGDVKGEMAMYARATNIDPTFGGAWINWGTSLAESGNFEDAEIMFLKALECCPDVASKAMMNLALVHQAQANNFAQGGDLPNARKSIEEASRYLDSAKPLLDEVVAKGTKSDDDGKYLAQFKPLRLQVHRLAGQILAGSGDYPACEAEVRRAAASYPDVPGVWEMLSRILDLQGKADEAKACKEKVELLLASGENGR